MVANFIGRDRRPFGYNNSDTNLFAQPVIGDTEHGTFGDCVMFKNRAFDFGTVNVFTTAQNHILGAVDDINKAFVINTRNVAGAKPAVLYGLCRGFGAVQIAFDDIAALNA